MAGERVSAMIPAVEHDGPIEDCSEIWFSPEFLVRMGPPWSLRPNLRDRLTGDGPWRFGYDLLIGSCITYETAEIKRIWRLDKPDYERHMLLGRWPD